MKNGKHSFDEEETGKEDASTNESAEDQNQVLIDDSVSSRRCSSCSLHKPLGCFDGKKTCNSCRPKKRKASLTTQSHKRTAQIALRHENERLAAEVLKLHEDRKSEASQILMLQCMAASQAQEIRMLRDDLKTCACRHDIVHAKAACKEEDPLIAQAQLRFPHGIAITKAAAPPVQKDGTTQPHELAFMAAVAGLNQMKYDEDEDV